MTQHTSTDVLTVLRVQAWERAKGELWACRTALRTTTADRPEVRERGNRLHETIEKFINEVEGNGLQE